MAEIRRARAEWVGDLPTGRGSVTATTSGLFSGLAVSWKARAERTVPGHTSPEELLAAAHASCFSMALAGELGRVGANVEHLEVNCSVTFDKADGGYRVASSVLDVRGIVPGIDPTRFRMAAETAGENCPISQALGGVKIEVHSQLAEAAPEQPHA